MKKIFLVSSIFALIQVMMFLTGILDYENVKNSMIDKGNKLYAAGQYKEALEAYKKGLEKDKDDAVLNNNSAQTSYRLQEYQQTVEYYGKAGDSIEKYMNSGNASLKLGDGISDINQKLQYYQQALEAYKQGILKYPEDLGLKYNYEYVKKMLDHLSENNNERKQSSNENSEEQKESQDNQSQGNKGQNSENQENKNQGNEGQESKEQDKQMDKDEKNNSGEDNNADTGENEQNGTQKNEQGNARESTGNSMQENMGAGNPQQGNSAEINEELLQVLDMLEKQEKESLKNNQDVKNYGKGEGYDW